MSLTFSVRFAICLCRQAPSCFGQQLAYKADGDCYIYDDLDERRMGSTTCDFCDRVFYRDDSNRYHGLSTRFRDHPDDPEGILVQEICDFCKEERPRVCGPSS